MRSKSGGDHRFCGIAVGEERNCEAGRDASGHPGLQGVSPGIFAIVACPVRGSCCRVAEGEAGSDC